MFKGRVSQLLRELCDTLLCMLKQKSSSGHTCLCLFLQKRFSIERKNKTLGLTYADSETCGKFLQRQMSIFVKKVFFNDYGRMAGRIQK